MSPAETAIEDPASAEQNLRIDMAAGFRWIEKTGMSDLTAGSLVTRLPGETEWMFTHPLGHYFDEICASDFFKVNYEGEAIDGSNHRVAFAATNPAAHLFRARPDVNATIHAHAPAVMAVSGLECGLLFASEPSFMFYKGISYLDTDFYFDDDYCRKVADTAGDSKAIIYRNHSFAVVGRDVKEAILRAYLLNQACEIQLRMMASGAKIHQPSDEQLQYHYDAFFGIADFEYDGSLEWPGVLRRLDREDPSYRN